MLIKDAGGQMSLFAPDLCYGKMSPERSVQARNTAKISGRFSKKSAELQHTDFLFLDLRAGGGNLLGPSWEINSPSLGEWSALNTFLSHNGARESCLSVILQATVPIRYYLSKTACLGILRRAARRGKLLPGILEKALKMQAGIMVRTTSAEVAGDSATLHHGAPHGRDAVPPCAPLLSEGAGNDDTGQPIAFAANQRDELRDLHNVAAAVCAQPGLKQQTFVTIPINTQVAMRHEKLGDGTGLGIGVDGDPAYTLQEAHSHAVFNAESNSLTPWDTQQARIFTEDSVAPAVCGADGGGGRNPAGLLLENGCMTAWDVQSRRIHDGNGVWPALYGGEGGGHGYVAAFCAGAGAKAGSIGYQEETSPTLKGSPSGNLMPSVLCLNG